jgi:hypothetical protein
MGIRWLAMRQGISGLPTLQFEEGNQNDIPYASGGLH